MTSFLHPTGRHSGLRGGDGIAGERAGIDGRGSYQVGGGRHVRRASCAVIESSSRGGACRRRRQRNRDGNRPCGSGCCRCGQRPELEPAVRRGRGDVLVGNGIGRPQGHLRLGRRVAERTSNRGWRSENRVQHPNALARGSAARGQWQILFPHDDTVRSCPRRDTPNEHVASANSRTTHLRNTDSVNDHSTHTGRKGVLERQISGQPISIDGEVTKIAQVLDPQRKFARQPVIS